MGISTDPPRHWLHQLFDLSAENQLDIVTLDTPPLLQQRLVWLEQPAARGMPWRIHLPGTHAADSIVGIASADIDSDATRTS